MGPRSVVLGDEGLFVVYLARVGQTRQSLIALESFRRLCGLLRRCCRSAPVAL